jgi:subtilisin-like proprotein convertase family protein
VVLHQIFSDYPPIPANGTGTNLIPFQLSTLPALACGSNIVLQLNISFAAGSFGNVGATFTLPTGHAGPTALFTNNTFLTIPDVTFVESTNAVSGIGGPISKVRVSVYLTHPNDGDLALRLIAPDGTMVVLSDFNGGPGDNYGADCAPGSYTVFDEAAATSISAGSPPYVGTFRPEGALAAYIGKSGADVNGNWRLQVEDDVFGGAAGTLRCWVLDITPVACAAGSGNCETCPGYITNSITNADPLSTDRVARNGTPGACGAPLPCGGAFSGTGPYHYDTYTFTNAGFAACVTVYLDTTCANALSASAHLGSYVPTNVCQNFLAEMGSDPSKTFDSFSFIAPAGTNFVIVVNEVFGGFGCDYTLMLTGIQCPRPILNITPVPADQVKLDWTTAAAGYALERTNTLVTGVFNWPPVTNNPVVVSGRFTVTNSVTGTSNNFYRLKLRLID